MAIQQYPFKGGIPSGNTAARPSSPAIGDTFYNGQLEILEIWNGSAWVAVSAPPATPSIATPTDTSSGDAYTSTAGKLNVVFTPGSGGGTPNQYNAYTTSGGFSASSSSASVTLTGLTPGTSYTVYGTAQNNFGTTVNTGNSASVTPTTRPQAPTIGTTTLSSGLPVVNWTLGSNGGKNLTSITITPYLNGTTAQTSRTAATTSSTSYAFTTGQLTEDSSYTFKVKVTNANGDSPESSASNSVTVNENLTIETLVVAGGGGGGSNGNTTGGGGGGAGGYLYSSSTSVTAGALLTVTVGAKGTGVNRISGNHTSAQSGNKGGNSSITGTGFTSITATGGGGGVSNQSGGTASDVNGGSGGGGNYSVAAGTGTSGQGNNGGQAWTYQNGANELAFAGGGGGGSGAVGGNATNEVGGSGGAGTANSITGTSVTYAGGGGAGARNGYTAGTGGSGGGGAGVTGTSNGSNATGYGSGGGGGGGQGDTPTAKGGDGSDGVVVIAYVDTLPALTIGAGLTYDQPSRSGYRVYRFTAGTGTVTF
jgi:hypothetical protein